MIYAALDEAVSFASPLAQQREPTQLERVTHAASEVAYAAWGGCLRRAGVVHAAS